MSLKVVMAASLALSFCCHEEVMVVSFCVVVVVWCVFGDLPLVA